jgi:hypothetical protein
MVCWRETVKGIRSERVKALGHEKAAIVAVI